MALKHSGFLEMHIIGNIGIIVNFVFPYIFVVSFLFSPYDINVIIDVTEGMRGLYLKVTDFFGLLIYVGTAENEVGNIGILVL